MSVRQRLEKDLIDAMRRRDGSEVKMIRILMSSIDNAAAVRVKPDSIPKIGLGHDVPRLELNADAVRRVIEAERDELAAAEATYRALGQTEHADELGKRGRIVDRYLEE